MSKKSRTYFPKYQLRVKGEGPWISCHSAIGFHYRDTYYFCDFPMFGATETQKSVLRWLAKGPESPPVVSISHEKPTKPDVRGLTDPNDPYRHFLPYAMAIAEIQLMSEEAPRKVKVYFCHVEYHNEPRHERDRSTTTRIIPL